MLAVTSSHYGNDFNSLRCFRSVAPYQPLLTAAITPTITDAVRLGDDCIRDGLVWFTPGIISPYRSTYLILFVIPEQICPPNRLTLWTPAERVSKESSKPTLGEEHFTSRRSIVRRAKHHG